MAEQPPAPHAFTGRLFHVEYTLHIVVPVPLGDEADPTKVQSHLGVELSNHFKAFPLISVYRLVPGPVTSEVTFQFNKARLVEAMTRMLKKQEAGPQPPDDQYVLPFPTKEQS